MKILWISLETPYPANTGGRQGVWNRLKRLAQEHEVYYFYTYDNKNEAHIPELEEICAQVVSVERTKNLSLIGRILKYPYTVASRCMPELERAVCDCVQNNGIDLINVDFPHMCAVVRQAACRYQIPVVLNEHNIEWKVYRQIASSASSALKRLVYWIDSWRLKWFEKRIVDQIKPKGITFVSQENMQEYAGWMNPSYAELKLVPVGIDCGVRCTTTGDKRKTIAFFGNMSYEPNVEGATWFAREVFPLIKQSVSEAKLYLVGREPSEKALSLANEDIIVTGTVPEVRSYYVAADLVVVPLLHGDGVKVKLLEAISYGKQIVSTAKGVEGTAFVNNGLLPVANDVQTFAKLCAERLSDPARFEEEADCAYEYCMNHYTWDGICRQYSDYMSDIVKMVNRKKTICSSSDI